MNQRHLFEKNRSKPKIFNFSIWTSSRCINKGMNAGINFAYDSEMSDRTKEHPPKLCSIVLK